MKKWLFSFFHRIARLFYGSGIRTRFPITDRLFKAVNQSLNPGYVIVHGHKFYLDPDDSMELSTRPDYEPLETRTLLANINPGDTVVDIGANIGYYTLLFAERVGPSGKVYGFEPHPASFEILKKNVKESGQKNIEIIQKAISDRNDKGVLFINKLSNVDHSIVDQTGERIRVEIDLVRLDDLLSGLKVDFIKMDIQGAEDFALKGMADTIQNNPQLKIMTEYWPGGLCRSGIEPIEFVRRLAGFGFRLMDIHTGTEKTPEQLGIDYQGDNQSNLLCIPQQA